MFDAARHDAARFVRLAGRRGAAHATGALTMLVVLMTSLAAAQPADSNGPAEAELTTERIAERLLATTVTVRILNPAPARPAVPAPQPATAPQAATAAAVSPTAPASPATSPAPATKAANGLPPEATGPERTQVPPPIAASAGNKLPLVRRDNAAERRAAGIRFNPQMIAALRQNADARITVGSGVSLGGGFIVTFSRGPTPSQFRLTLADGEQAQARLVVQDLYSGLCLLKTDTEGLPALKIATDTPEIGAWLMTAAASGIDRPLIAQGIVGGIDRVPRGTELPPLLQCDLRTTETSCGSPVVNRQGKLVGIVAAVSAAPAVEGDAQAGWTFVVPARYIARLLAARLDNEVVILQRQRPSLGLTLLPGEELGTVRVEKVDPGGPAEVAGIRAGDWVLETDGRKIRSPYQVMSLVQRKQPGERIGFVIVSDDGQARQVNVTLSSALPESNPRAVSTLVEPRAEARSTSATGIEVTRRGQIAELGVDLKPRPASVAAPDESKLIRDQIAAFEQAIQQLRAQLKQRDEKLTETDRQVQKLQAELDSLRAKGAPPK